VASTVAEAAFTDGSYQLTDCKLTTARHKQVMSGLEDAAVLHLAEEERLGGMERLGPCRALLPLMHIAPVEELTGAFRLPVAGHASPYCIRKNTDPPHVSADALIYLGHDDEPNAQRGAGQSTLTRRGILLEGLCKHLFICGVPGSGKTTAALHLMHQLSERGIPFIVLEPAKTEYRLLKCLQQHKDRSLSRLARNLQVYTPGDDRISPFRFNPLEIPEGIGRDEHIENLLNSFKAALPMSGPLPALLSEALEEVYEGDRPSGEAPRMIDLFEAARTVLSRKGYSGEVDSNIRGALEVRLGLLTRLSIGRVFQCAASIPSVNGLLEGSTLVELAALPGEQACLLTLFILTAIREQIKAIPYMGGAPRLVIFLEEAHNLVGRSGDAQASEENADPKAFAVDFISRMLAELRALGVAIVILDQLPSAVAPEVVKQAGTKVCFREVDHEDRDIIGGSMLFGPIEFEETARLRPGEAYLYTEGYFGPQRICTPNLHAQFGLPRPPVGDAILQHIRDDTWFTEASLRRVTVEAGQLFQEMNTLESLRTRVMGRVATLTAKRVSILRNTRQAERPGKLEQLANEALVLQSRLGEAIRSFTRSKYRPLLPCDVTGIRDEAVRAFCDSLVSRFEHVIRPDAQSCMKLLARLVSECESDSTGKRGA